MPVSTTGQKTCNGCKLTKLISEFPTQTVTYKDKKYTYPRSQCKVCQNQKVQAWRQKQPKPIKRLKVFNDHKDLAMMERAPSWAVQKRGYEESFVKVYPICDEGHRYVGDQCLPCKYQVYARTVV